MKNFKTLILLFTITLFTACGNDDDASTQDTGTLELDREALIEIYNANTNNTMPWDITTTDLTKWEGVVVENDRVTGLNIGARNLDVIPATALKQLTALIKLTANDNNFTSIDVSNNINLTRLGLFNNQLTSINISKNILLEQLLLESNSLTSLDVSALANLTDLKAGSNDFTGSINIANGNNANMWRMNVGSNSNLSCIKVDAGATSGFVGWTKPSNASYNTTCQ